MDGKILPVGLFRSTLFIGGANVAHVLFALSIQSANQVLGELKAFVSLFLSGTWVVGDELGSRWRDLVTRHGGALVDRRFLTSYLACKSIARSVAFKLPLPLNIAPEYPSIVNMMLIRKHPALVTMGALTYAVHVCGQERTDGTWEGWIEFHPSGTASILRTDQETSQPNRTALEYWADGLEPVYLEGALARAQGRLL